MFSRSNPPRPGIAVAGGAPKRPIRQTKNNGESNKKSRRINKNSNNTRKRLRQKLIVQEARPTAAVPNMSSSPKIVDRRIHKSDTPHLATCVDSAPLSSSSLKLKSNNDPPPQETQKQPYLTNLIPKLPREVVFGMVTSSVKQLRSGLEVLSHLEPEGVICFSRSSLRISCLTESVQASIDMDVKDCVDIEEYKYRPTPAFVLDPRFPVREEKCHDRKGDPANPDGQPEDQTEDETEHEFCVSLDKVFRAMSIATVNDVVALYITKHSLASNAMILEIHHQKGAYVHSNEIRVIMKTTCDSSRDKTDMRAAVSTTTDGVANAIITASTTTQVDRKKVFKASVQMSTADFLKTLRCGNKNGDTVQIFTKYDEERKNNYCYIAVKGKRLGSDMHSRFFFSVQGMQKVDCYNQNLYDMKKLLVVAKATNMSTLIHLYLNPFEDVLGMKYRVGTIGVFRCMIAPLVEKSTLVFGAGGVKGSCDRGKSDVQRQQKQQQAEQAELDLTF